MPKCIDRKEEVEVNIDAYSEIFKSTAISRPKTLGSSIASEIVQKGYQMKDYQTAMKAVAACSDVREELTTPLKEKIQAGTYKVDADVFAEKLLRKISER